jgi:aminoglycoside 3-N-acetyltransferase
MTVAKMSKLPHTISSLSKDLRSLGVAAGDTLLVHSSYKAIGDVCGGVVSVILALEGALGKQGTLVMPTFTDNLVDPRDLGIKSESRRRFIRKHLPAFDPDLTPVNKIGIIAETFRKQKEVLRNSHPHLSFAAWGKHARHVIARHSLDFALGERSPLARLYDLDAWVLLLGVGHYVNTAIHLAEYRQNDPPTKKTGWDAPRMICGKRRWVKFKDIDNTNADFVRIGKAYERRSRKVKRGNVGQANCKLMPVRELVDFSVEWMNRNRKKKQLKAKG